MFLVFTCFLERCFSSARIYYLFFVGELVQFSRPPLPEREGAVLQLFPSSTANPLPVMMVSICLIPQLHLQTTSFQIRGVCEGLPSSSLFPLVPCPSSENSYNTDISANTFFPPILNIPIQYLTEMPENFISFDF